LVGEPVTLVERADVRPALRDLVDGDRAKLAARVLPLDAPLLERGDAGVHQRISGVVGVEAAHEPADLTSAAVVLADVVSGAEAVKERSGDDRASPDRDQRAAVDHPRVDDGLARLPLELAHHGVDRERDSRDDGRDMRV
jgi:hypothetical protein